MFTAIAFNKSSWLEQKNHGFSIDTRPVLDHFPLVYRRPNENRTRNKRKTNERATNVDRVNSEKLSKTRRNATIMAGGTPFSNHKPAQCLLSQICRGRTLHFHSILCISTANKTISHIPCITMIQSCRKSSLGF